MSCMTGSMFMMTDVGLILAHIVTNGRNRQSRASIVGGSNLNGLPFVASAKPDHRVLQSAIGRDLEFFKMRHPVPVEIRPQ